MNRLVLGAFCALILVGVGLFWLQGRAEVERGAPPPEPVEIVEDTGPEALPSAAIDGMRGPAPPEATELSREERRFYRYDRNRDRTITRYEMMSSRTDGFRDLDVDGNNLLTFEEWAISTAERFDGMDTDRNDELTMAEFATTAPKPRSSSSCSC